MTEFKKQTLVEQIKGAHSKLDAAVDGLTYEQMSLPGVESDWSVRDVLAHILFWEQRALFLLKSARDGYTKTDDRWIGNVDDLNATNHVSNKNRPVQDVIDEERTVFSTLLRILDATTEETLFARGLFSWVRGHSLASVVAGETFEHILDHIDALNRWRSSHVLS